MRDFKLPVLVLSAEDDELGVEVLMSKGIARMSLHTLSFLLSIATMIYGWGVSPKSWAWIIGAGLFGQLLVMVLLLVVMKEESK